MSWQRRRPLVLVIVFPGCHEPERLVSLVARVASRAETRWLWAL